MYSVNSNFFLHFCDYHAYPLGLRCSVELLGFPSSLKVYASMDLHP